MVESRKITTISFNLDEQRELIALQDATGIHSTSILLKALVKKYLYEYKVDSHQEKYLPEFMKRKGPVVHKYGVLAEEEE